MLHPAGPTPSAEPSVRTVRFDYADPSTFEAALEGVERLFWVSPPARPRRLLVVPPLFEKALSRVKRVVLMTADGVELSEEIPLRKMERFVETSGVDFVHLRPTWFMDNFHTFWIGSIRSDGVIALPAAEARTAFIDARDIGRSASAALVRDDVSRSAYQADGPRSADVRRGCGDLEPGLRPNDPLRADRGRRIRRRAVSAGIQREYAFMLVQLFTAVRAGFASEPSPAVRELTGDEPSTLETYARDFAALFA
ncbi:MAG: hypothetical protein HC923_00110 [Myxococcales bacterium]|nr:hypothetical protein [Myxococcales bacterium]